MTQPFSRDSEVLERVRDILASSAEINTFCQSNYTTDQSVVCGFDPKDPPKKDHCPGFQLNGFEKKNNGERFIDYRIPVVACVNDDRKETDGNKITQTGVLRAEDLRELGEEACIKSKNLGKVIVEGDTLPNSIFPMFTSSFTLVLQFPKNMKGS